MTRTTPPLAPQAGLSIPEATVAAALVFAVLAMLSRGVSSVAMGSQASDQDLKRATMQRNALAAMQTELEACSIRNRRFEIASDGKSIRFWRLIGADLASGEVSGTWSSPIEIGLQPPGNIVRRQDGNTALLATGISELRVTQPAGSDCFEVTVVSAGPPRAGVATNVSRSARIFPKN